MKTHYIKLTPEQWESKKQATSAKQEHARAQAKEQEMQRREDLFNEAVEAHKGQYKAVPENPRYIAFDDGKIWSKRTSRFLKPSNHPLGYLFIGKFMINDKYSLQLLHRMIAITFIPNHEGFPEINHKDGDKHNNHVDNLEWCSRAYNMQHARKNGLMVFGMTNKASTRRKLTFEQAEEIRRKYNEGGILVGTLAKHYNLDSTAIKRIINGTTYKVRE